MNNLVKITSFNGSIRKILKNPSTFWEAKQEGCKKLGLAGDVRMFTEDGFEIEDDYVFQILRHQILYFLLPGEQVCKPVTSMNVSSSVVQPDPYQNMIDHLSQKCHNPVVPKVPKMKVAATRSFHCPNKESDRWNKKIEVVISDDEEPVDIKFKPPDKSDDFEDDSVERELKKLLEASDPDNSEDEDYAPTNSRLSRNRDMQGSVETEVPPVKPKKSLKRKMPTSNYEDGDKEVLKEEDGSEETVEEEADVGERARAEDEPNKAAKRGRRESEDEEETSTSNRSSVMVNLKEAILERIKYRIKSTVTLRGVPSKCTADFLKRLAPEMLVCRVPWNILNNTVCGAAELEFMDEATAKRNKEILKMKMVENTTLFADVTDSVDDVNIEDYNCRWLRLNNLHQKTTEEDIRSIFSKASDIDILLWPGGLMADEHMPVTGIITFRHKRDAMDAFDKYQGCVIRGHNISVNFYREESRLKDKKQKDRTPSSTSASERNETTTDLTVINLTEETTEEEPEVIFPKGSDFCYGHNLTFTLFGVKKDTTEAHVRQLFPHVSRVDMFKYNSNLQLVTVTLVYEDAAQCVKDNTWARRTKFTLNTHRISSVSYPMRDRLNKLDPSLTKAPLIKTDLFVNYLSRKTTSRELRCIFPRARHILMPMKNRHGDCPGFAFLKFANADLAAKEMYLKQGRVHRKRAMTITYLNDTTPTQEVTVKNKKKKKSISEAKIDPLKNNKQVDVSRLCQNNDSLTDISCMTTEYLEPRVSPSSHIKKVKNVSYIFEKSVHGTITKFGDQHFLTDDQGYLFNVEIAFNGVAGTATWNENICVRLFMGKGNRFKLLYWPIEKFFVVTLKDQTNAGNDICRIGSHVFTRPLGDVWCYDFAPIREVFGEKLEFDSPYVMNDSMEFQITFSSEPVALPLSASVGASNDDAEAVKKRSTSKRKRSAANKENRKKTYINV